MYYNQKNYAAKKRDCISLKDYLLVGTLGVD
jgi:hypothetical protein